MQTIQNRLSKLIHFFTTDIWRLRLIHYSGVRSFFFKQLIIISMAMRGYHEDKCMLRASALTYYSLLSIVPVFAMAFGIAKGFGFEKLLEKQILEKLPGQEEVLIQVVNFARSMIENTQGGMIAGIGLVLLFWMVIKVLGNIESAFNHIWGIKKARNIVRKFSDYLSIMLICPVLVILSSSITVFVRTQITLITGKVVLLGFISPFIFFLLKLLPLCLIWLLFSFMYIVIPNTRVKFTSGLVAGVVAGTLYYIIQWFYIFFQIGVTKLNAIYGSFAALPLFLVWLQLSWLIVLLGAELSFAHKNVDTYEFSLDYRKISPYFKRLISLKIVHLLVKNFTKGEKPLNSDQISHTLEIPVLLARQILGELVESAILCEINTEENRKAAYQPARDVDVFTIQYIIDALERRGIDNIPVAQTEVYHLLVQALETFGETIKASPANRLLKDI